MFNVSLSPINIMDGDAADLTNFLHMCGSGGSHHALTATAASSSSSSHSVQFSWDERLGPGSPSFHRSQEAAWGAADNKRATSSPTNNGSRHGRKTAPSQAFRLSKKVRQSPPAAGSKTPALREVGGVDAAGDRDRTRKKRKQEKPKRRWERRADGGKSAKLLGTGSRSQTEKEGDSPPHSSRVTGCYSRF